MRFPRRLIWLLSCVAVLLSSCALPPDDAELRAALVGHLERESPDLVDRIVDAYADPDDYDRLVVQTDYGTVTSILGSVERICDESRQAELLETSVVTAEDLTDLWLCDSSGTSRASPYMESLRQQEEAEARAREQQRLEEERIRKQQEELQRLLDQYRSGNGSGSYSGGSCGQDYYRNSRGACVHRPSDSNLGGATARCRDGTYSYSQSRSGTCSHHGGVAEWY